jgi:hypothetical protein
MWKESMNDAAERLCLPGVDEQALAGLKFSEALPTRLAIATLAARGADLDGAARVLAEAVRFWTKASAPTTEAGMASSGRPPAGSPTHG